MRPSYQSNPACAEGREPKRHRESLKQREPEIILFDAAKSKLRTKEDWKQAGKLVLESDNSFSPPPAIGFEVPQGPHDTQRPSISMRRSGRHFRPSNDSQFTIT